MTKPRRTARTTTLAVVPAAAFIFAAGFARSREWLATQIRGLEIGALISLAAHVADRRVSSRRTWDQSSAGPANGVGSLATTSV